MQTGTVIVKNIRGGLGFGSLPGRENALGIEAVGFDGLEKGFGAGVIPAVSLAAHAREGFGRGEGFLERAAGKLTSPVGMDDQTRRGLSEAYSMAQRANGQIGVDCLTEPVLNFL
jgi:hypothetical protein